MHEHDAIIDAIRARDGARAEAAMKSHIDRSYGRLRDFIKEITVMPAEAGIQLYFVKNRFPLSRE